jgi:hypothetical protein
MILAGMSRSHIERIEMNSLGGEELLSKQFACMIRDFKKAKRPPLILSAHARGRVFQDKNIISGPIAAI